MTDNNPDLASESTCVDCGASIDGAWQFCGSCGARTDGATNAEFTVVPLRAAEPDAGPTTGQPDNPPVHDDPPVAAPATAPVEAESTAVAAAKTRSRWRRWAPAACVIAALLVVVSVVTVNELGTHHRLARTRASLASTQDELDKTKSSLQTTQADLATRTAERDARTAERDTLQGQLASTQTELTGTKGTLSQAQNQISIQAGQLTELKTCVDGFATALQDDLYGDYSAGLSALQSVQTACQASQQALGG